MSELSALAGSEGYGACADEGIGVLPNKRTRKTASFPDGEKDSFVQTL